jgi:hypothetical protein
LRDSLVYPYFRYNWPYFGFSLWNILLASLDPFDGFDRLTTSRLRAGNLRVTKDRKDNEENKAPYGCPDLLSVAIGTSSE